MFERLSVRRKRKKRKMYIFYKVIFDAPSNEASETEVFSVRIDLVLWKVHVVIQ